jgi:hypothetical protein
MAPVVSSERSRATARLAWILVAAGLAAGRPAVAGGECTFEKTATGLRLGNAQVEIRIDAQTGAVTGVRNKTAGVEYLGAGTPGVFDLVYATWPAHGARTGDRWGAGHGTVVHGREQKVTSAHFERTGNGGRLEVAYESIQLERRALELGVRYSIEIADGDEETRWRLSLDNRSEGTVREVRFPLLSGLGAQDALLMPNHSGQKMRNPLELLSDESPVISLEYPARASMQWFHYGSPRAGLYLASYDQGMEYTRLSFGRPSDERREAAVWITKFPFAAQGSRWESPVLAVGPHAGDWHWGADRYREWLDTWVKEADVPRRIRTMSGGHDETLIKDMAGKVVHTYAEAAAIARRLPASSPFMFVGWMPHGHDTFYPEYVPIEDLGGKDALVAAIDSVHASGRLVSAYFNGRLANVETETYKRHGKQWAVVTRSPGAGLDSLSLSELHENWNDRWERHGRGEGWFAVMCPSAKGWQDHIVSEGARVVGDYRFDGLFVDQPGSFYAQLCYAPWHGHRTPATAWGPGYLEVFRRLREATRRANPESYLWIEGMNDVYARYVDYHLDKNPVWLPMRTHPAAETFAEMWRYALPAAITVNDAAVYSFPPARDPVYGDAYHFVMGIRGIGAPLPEGAVLSPEDAARRRALDARISRLWNAGARFFLDGRFVDDVGLRVDAPSVLAKAYRGETGVAVALWNTGAEPIAAEIRLDRRLAGEKPLDVRSLDGGKPLPQRKGPDGVLVRVDLPPHGIDAIVLRDDAMVRATKSH